MAVSRFDFQQTDMPLSDQSSYVWKGLSTDAKPTASPVKSGDFFFETDTGNVSKYTGSLWLPYPQTGASFLGPVLVDGSYYGLVPSTTADQTQNFINAFTDSAARGVVLRLSSGEFHYTNIIDNAAGGIIGAGRGLTKIICETSNGDNSRFGFVSQSDVVVCGVTFSTANGDVTVNNAGETACILRFNGGSRIWVWDCNFEKIYGIPILMRSIVVGGMYRNLAKNVGKDSFHITGLSQGLTRSNNVVENGGDDAFPVVGYRSTGTTGQPIGITDIGNKVYGVRTGRGFAYVGCKEVSNVACEVYGASPTDPTIISPVTGTTCGLLVISDSSFDSFGNEDIKVRQFKARDCGKSPYGGSVQVVGRAGLTTRNIDIEATCDANGLRGFYASGGVSGGIQNLRFVGVVDDTTDPDGIGATAGTGTANWCEFTNVQNIDVELIGINAGGAGVFVANTCTGAFRGRIRVNETSINSTQSLVQFQTTSALERVDLDLSVDAQTAGINRIVDSSPVGVTRIRYKSNVAITSASAIFLGAPLLTAPTIGASPGTYTNAASVPIALRVTGGTVSQIETAMITGIATPSYSTRKYGGSNATSGIFELAPGEGIRITYTVLPTVDARALWY